jgi:tRNA pseudouridine38-40 synthase
MHIPQNILLHLAFTGTAYHGFQVQANAPTVCAALQDAMQWVLGCRPDVKGCSRTDAGVHARGFALSFLSDTAIPMERLPLALNSRLPADIRVLGARLVPPGFHARYSALGKRYRYTVLNRGIDDPFTDGFYYRVPHPLDVGAMAEAAAALAGTHDFAAFTGSGGDTAGSTVRTLTRLSVERDAPWLTITAAGNGFLYHMVRILAGTLLEVGLGRIPPARVAGILAGRDRRNAGPTLPAKGLCLEEVFYQARSAE